MATTQLLISEEDTLYLEALADLSDDGLDSDSENASSSDEFALAPEDEDIFDSFDTGTDLSLLTYGAVVQNITAREHVGNGTKCSLSNSDLTTSIGSDVAAYRIREIRRTLKRSISEETLPFLQEGEKPAKMNKSFSEGLDQVFSQISLSSEIQLSPAKEPNVVQQDEVPVALPFRAKPWPSSAELEAELAIEAEISKVLDGGDDDGKDEFEGKPLQFHIPPDVLSRATKAAKTSSPIYWSHTLYRGPSDARVQIHYCRTKAQSESVASSFLNEPILGFDMEWVVHGSKDVQGLKRCVSLIQLGCEDRVALFHTALHDGTTAEDLIAPSLKKILESEKITKTGVNILNADAKRLECHFGLRPQGLLELSSLNRMISGKPEMINDRLIALAKQVEWNLQLPLLKDDVRTSNWGKELDEKQMCYAADDAYAGYMLYRVMEAKRLKMVPRVRRPAFAELGIPLRMQIRVEEQDVRGEEKQNPDNTEDNAANSNPTTNPVRKSDAVDNLTLDERAQTIFNALCNHHLATTNLQNAVSTLAVSKAVLKAIAVSRPLSINALKMVKGVGPAKLQQYGRDWVRIVQEHSVQLEVVEKNEGERTAQAILPSDIREQEYNTYVRILKALEGLHDRLRKDERFNIGEIPADTLKNLARLKPSTSRALVLVPGAIELNTAATCHGVDLLGLIRRHAEAAGDKEKRVADGDSSDDDAFQVMEVSDDHVNRRRWRV
ncbi:hypothetical protein NA57DRAFT_54700 [Rhizodiscina lignyota]|uniref:HRDC domain-containing protein n=1 Tax=Rhizodiscina lignyota TaxID=1504668 RepID=A0A9P4ILI2_9PEZI|nr:hypothetical protein NA57DRAFT_54700 [Rhizodiscina lignyota]